MMLLLATAMFGIFFFLTIFVQTVLGYSALKSGFAFLPFAGTIVVVSGIVSQLVARTGARPLMLAGAALTTVGMYWFSRVGVHSTYLNGLLGPILVEATGLGMLFVPLQLVALTRVRDEDSGVASSLLNTGQQVGGAIGLAALGTVTWTAVAGSVRSQVAHAAAAGSGHGLALAQPGSRLPAAIYSNALATGISRGFLVASGIALAALVIALVSIRVSRADLAGAGATGATPAPVSANGASRPLAGVAASGRSPVSDAVSDLRPAMRPAGGCRSPRSQPGSQRPGHDLGAASRDPSVSSRAWSGPKQPGRGPGLSSLVTARAQPAGSRPGPNQPGHGPGLSSLRRARHRYRCRARLRRAVKPAGMAQPAASPAAFLR